MRFEQVEIAGFGRLHDLSARLGPRVTVILGPNESGKSTMHRLLRAALYGLDAGGPGRPVERSDWTRLMPWDGGRYGFAVTYRLDDGRRFRVACRLESREHQVQVVEVGGADVTDSLRRGRAVEPGFHHLGFDDQVFCATGWLAEDGLTTTAADTPARRARRLQEAVEDLSDSGGDGVSTAEALGLLDAALQRIGTERALSTPLGQAGARLRQLDEELDLARRRHAAFAADSARLRDLELAAERAEAAQRESERAWLLGKLAALAARRLEIQHTITDMRALQGEIVDLSDAAGFPVEHEATVVSLAAELTEARTGTQEAEQRWREAAEQLQATRKRRGEIAAGLDALGEPMPVTAAMLEQRDALVADLAQLRGEQEALGSGDAIAARLASLRHEIAQTGMGAVPGETLPAIEPLVESVRRRGRGIPTALTTTVLGLGVAGLGYWLVNHSRAALVVAAAATVVLVICGLWSWLNGRTSRSALRGLRTLMPDADLGPEAIDRLWNRLPALTALQQDVERQQSQLAEHEQQAALLMGRLHDIHLRVVDLLRSAGLDQGDDEEGLSIARVRETIGMLDRVAEVAERCRELAAEDALLARSESALALVSEQAERALRRLHDLEERLDTVLAEVGLDPDLSVEDAVGAFRLGCERRRRLETATAELETLRRRHAPASLNEAAVDELFTALTRRLIDRGGDPAAVAQAEPLDESRLAELEHRVEEARTQSVAAAREAGELAARLAGAMDGLRDLADLEDERATVANAQRRARHQRAALERAATLLQDATRGVHRELAPRLCAALERNLALLSDGRYTAVNVDTDRFGVSLLSRDRPDLIPLDQLSHGTRDQVNLLLRIALAEVLSDRGEAVPLLLDEPLLAADGRRRDVVLDFLLELSGSHQLVITTTEPQLAADIIGRIGDDAAVVELAVDPAVEVTGQRSDTPSPVDWNSIVS